MKPDRQKLALSIIRTAVATLLIIHGVARIWLGIVDDFGLFLEAQGFPLGAPVAWLITIVEIAGGTSLALGRLVRVLCVWFIIELVTGIALVHVPEGWFVVGAGRNGVEYSVLLIVCLAAVLLAWKGPLDSTT